MRAGERKKLELKLQKAKNALAKKEASENLLRYMQLRMGDPLRPGDIERSRYQVTALSKVLCDLIEKIDRGEIKRVCLSVGPQMGKSDILSRGGLAWLSGRDPYRNIMLGAYNQDFASEFGENVRDLCKSQMHRMIFPNHYLKTATTSHMVTVEGGQLNFVGVGGSGTGKPADIFVVDDPIRNDEDAQSEVYREKLWKWFNSVVFSRCHDKSIVIVVHTRWHQDDLIGRLCDPDHPERNGKYKGIAENWTYINIPAVVYDEQVAMSMGLMPLTQEDPKVREQFGEEPCTSIWPGRKGLEFLAEAKNQDERIFGALYMGNPTPEDGDYFKKDMLVEYSAHELPENLRVYGASDHAVSTKQMADKTVLGCVGVDKNDDIWILPDLRWERMETDKTVESIIELMTNYDPMIWWMESELISKSFGPFLKKRMLEEKQYTYIEPVTPSADKMTRARSIQGRMSMKKVHFPRHAPWWSDAKAQLLKFPFGTHDDFVDFIAHIGVGLRSMLRANVRSANDNSKHRAGSIEWILNETETQAKFEKMKAANAGW